jgi:hypothetical protein
MADRTKLAQAAKDLIAWINVKEVNPATLTDICTPDVVVPIPYPGSTPDLAGLIAVTEKIHGASPDWTMTLQKMVIDETEGRVVCLCRSQGTQAGYVSPPPKGTELMAREWLGIPPTGKKFDTLGFMSAKVLYI